MSLRVFLLIKDNNEPCFLIALSFVLMSSMTFNCDRWIYQTKNICGCYYATEIKGGDSWRLLGLKDSAWVSSIAV
mgnify:CR=1 FL=1